MCHNPDSVRTEATQLICACLKSYAVAEPTMRGTGVHTLWLWLYVPYRRIMHSCAKIQPSLASLCQKLGLFPVARIRLPSSHLPLGYVASEALKINLATGQSCAGEPLKGRSSSLTAIQPEVSGKIDVPKPIIPRNEAIL